MIKFFKIFLLFVFLQLVLTNINAQKGFSVGVKGGISIPNLVAQGDDPVTRGYSSILGPYFGILSEYKFGGKFSLQAEFNYSSQGGQKNGDQTLPTGSPSKPYVYATFDAKATLSYLELPLLAKFTFNINKKWSFFINGGPYVGYLLSARTITKGNGHIYADEARTQPITFAPVSFDDDQDLKDQAHPFNFGIQGGMGFSLKMKKGNLFINAGGNYGFIPVQKNKADGENYTGAATIAIGYLLPLRRN